MQAGPERGRFSNLTRSDKQGLRITVPSLWGTLPIEMASKAMTLPMNLVNKILILKTDWILKKESFKLFRTESVK